MAKGVLGAQLYSCRQHTQTMPDIVETLAKVARIGYTQIQISGFGEVDPKDVSQAVEDSGLTVAATHMGWPTFLDDIDTVIATHKLWHCKHPAIGGLAKEYRSADGLRRFLDELPAVGEKLAAEGMDFSYHNHAHELARIGEKTWLESLYEQADPKHLCAEIDTHWIVAGGGDPVWWVNLCAGREPLIHLKDFTMVDGERRFAEIGEGNLNWPRILEAAEAGGVEHYLIEQDDCYGRDCFESLAISYRNLTAMGLS